MKILLVNPEVPATFWSLKNALKFVSKKALLPPLGLLTVAAMLPKHDKKKLVDMNITPLRDRDIRWADYVFITGMLIQKKSADGVIARCNVLGVKVVAGGPLFTSCPEFYPTVDHLVLKEAELTLPTFLRDLEANCTGPYYSTRAKADLRKTPVPQWDLINPRHYAAMGIQYSRGCPFNCDFCDVTNLFGHAIRTKTTDQILTELDGIYSHGWREEVFFVDDNFIGKKEKLKKELLPAIIRWMEEKHHPFTFLTQASIDLADDEELMTQMVQAGFNCVFIGIESPNQESLAECNKVQNEKRDMLACIKKIQQFGLQVQGGFILGFDSDEPTVFDRVIQFIQDSGVVTAMVGLLNAPRGTKLYKRMMLENRLSSPPTGDNMDCTMNFVPKMDMQELLKGYQKVLDTIYSQKYYCQRVKTFLKNYNFSKKMRFSFHFRDMEAFLKSIWHIGILDKDRLHYWKLILWSLKKPRRFPMAVRFAIFGFHFRKTFENLQHQIQELSKTVTLIAPSS
jgi:radical SAM superfamily enzyme YgiQ (UPF0313 family)